MSAVVIDDKVVHYEVLGRGPPILFIHGWIGSWRYWIPTMQTASTRYRTYALDLWGFGDSSRDPECYPIERQIELVRQFLVQLGVARAAIVGHGLGGVIAVQFAARYPEFAARVMAVSVPLSAATVNPRFTDSSVDGLVDWLTRSVAEAEAGSITSEAAKTDAPVIAATLADLHTIDLRAEFSELAAPCLLVHGESDPAIAAPQDEWLQGVRADALRRIAFEDAQHFPMLENTPQFNRLLLDFLEAGDALEDLSLKEEWKRRMR